MLLQREKSDVGWSYLFFSEGQLPVPDKWCVKGYARKEECNLFDAPAGFCSTILASFPSSHHMQRQREKKWRRWWRYFFFVSERTGSGFRWNSWYARNEAGCLIFPDVPKWYALLVLPGRTVEMRNTEFHRVPRPVASVRCRFCLEPRDFYTIDTGFNYYSPRHIVFAMKIRMQVKISVHIRLTRASLGFTSWTHVFGLAQQDTTTPISTVTGSLCLFLVRGSCVFLWYVAYQASTLEVHRPTSPEFDR